MPRNSRPPDEQLNPTGEPLTPEQQERAWLLYFYDALRKQSVLREKAKAAFDEQTAVMTDIFRLAKAEAGFPRKMLQRYLDDGKLTSNVLSAEEETRIRHKTWLGQPIGFQPDLFEDKRPVEVKDEAWARGVGYAAGLRGEACVMPDEMHARFAQPFAKGWGLGQEELSWALSEVGKIIDRRPDANANPVNLEPEPDEDEQSETEASAEETDEAQGDPAANAAEVEAAELENAAA